MREDIFYYSTGRSVKPFCIKLSGITYPDSTYHITRTNSDVFCIEYIIDGTGTVNIDGKMYYPKKGDTYILKAGSNHDYYSDSEKPWKKIWFNASGALIEAIISSYNLGGFVVFENCDTLCYFDEIKDICLNESGAENIDMKSSIIFHRLIEKLYSCVKTTSHISKEAQIIKSYIDRNITEHISIQKLASLIYKSKSQVIRIFKNEIGFTPYEYLLDKRLTLAKTLLKSTNLLVKEVAFRTGFSDEHYFSDLFKRKCYITPMQYRNKE